ncbi:hypothetical protein R0K04_30195, partial [Pseudoalteromonas sp. SIMBA_153]
IRAPARDDQQDKNQRTKDKRVFTQMTAHDNFINEVTTKQEKQAGGNGTDTGKRYFAWVN